jgi:hypothetical protein
MLLLPLRRQFVCNTSYSYLTPQPNRHTLSSGESSGILAQEISLTTVYSVSHNYDVILTL